MIISYFFAFHDLNMWKSIFSSLFFFHSCAIHVTDLRFCSSSCLPWNTNFGVALERAREREREWGKSMSIAVKESACWTRNYHWQDNLSANMFYFIKSLFDWKRCVIITLLFQFLGNLRVCAYMKHRVIFISMLEKERDAISMCMVILLTRLWTVKGYNLNCGLDVC